MKIFTNQYDATDTWSAQGATVQWGKGAYVAGQDYSGTQGDVFPLLMQQVQVTYSRRAQEVAGINSDNKGNRKRYRIYDAPTGELRVTSIFSPYPNKLKAFLEAVSKDCKQSNEQVWLSLSPFGRLSCSQGTGATEASNTSLNTFGKFMLFDVDLETLGLQIQAGQNGSGAVSTMPMVFSFSILDWNVENKQS